MAARITTPAVFSGTLGARVGREHRRVVVHRRDRHRHGLHRGQRRSPAVRARHLDHVLVVRVRVRRHFVVRGRLELQLAAHDLELALVHAARQAEADRLPRLVRVRGRQDHDAGRVFRDAGRCVGREHRRVVVHRRDRHRHGLHRGQRRSPAVRARHLDHVLVVRVGVRRHLVVRGRLELQLAAHDLELALVRPARQAEADRLPRLVRVGGRQDHDAGRVFRDTGPCVGREHRRVVVHRRDRHRHGLHRGQRRSPAVRARHLDHVLVVRVGVRRHLVVRGRLELQLAADDLELALVRAARQAEADRLPRLVRVGGRQDHDAGRVFRDTGRCVGREHRRVVVHRRDRHRHGLHRGQRRSPAVRARHLDHVLVVRVGVRRHLVVRGRLELQLAAHDLEFALVRPARQAEADRLPRLVRVGGRQDHDAGRVFRRRWAPALDVNTGGLSFTGVTVTVTVCTVTNAGVPLSVPVTSTTYLLSVLASVGTS